MPSLPHVLVADDDGLFRALLREELIEAGFEVTTAMDGAEAVARARTEGPFDVLVLDELSGRSALSVLRGVGVKTPAILMSGGADVGSSEQQRLGFQAVLPKPLHIHELISALWAAMAHGSLDAA